jgi:heptosyltransferase-2
MNVLLVAPAWVGDMVMAHSLVSRLGERHPGAVIDLLAPAATLPLAARMPGVRRAIEMPLGHGQLGLAERFRLGRSLAGTGYDRAIVLPNSWKSALVPFFAGIPVRSGWHGEARFGLLNDRRRLIPDHYPLMIERFLALAQPPGETLQAPYPEPRLQADADNRQRLLAQLGLADTRPALALCPGAEFGPAKRWPAKHFAAVADAALARGLAVWLVGSPKDAAVCEEIVNRCSGAPVNLAGRTSLLDAVDLLSGVAGVVSNDSGLMHVACALQRPVAAVFGATSPDFTPPLGERARVLREPIACSPCFQRRCPLGHQRCLTELAPAAVIAAMSELGVFPAGAPGRDRPGAGAGRVLGMRLRERPG